MKEQFSIKDTQKLSNKDRPSFVGFAEIQFDGTTFTIDLADEMRVDENNIVESMVQHSGKYGWWIGVHTTAKRKMRKLKRERDKQYASLDIEARESLKDQGIKVTESGVRAYLDRDPRIQEKEKEIEALEDLVEYSDAVMRGLDHKRDMIKEINRNMCNEAYNIRQ